MQLWDAVMQELCTQVEVECAERGRLLELAREHYVSAIKALEEQLDREVRRSTDLQGTGPLSALTADGNRR